MFGLKILPKAGSIKPTHNETENVGQLSCKVAKGFKNSPNLIEALKNFCDMQRKSKSPENFSFVIALITPHPDESTFFSENNKTDQNAHVEYEIDFQINDKSVYKLNISPKSNPNHFNYLNYLLNTPELFNNFSLSAYNSKQIIQNNESMKTSSKSKHLSFFQINAELNVEKIKKNLDQVKTKVMDEINITSINNKTKKNCAKTIKKSKNIYEKEIDDIHGVLLNFLIAGGKTNYASTIVEGYDTRRFKQNTNTVRAHEKDANIFKENGISIKTLSLKRFKG